MLLRLSFAVDQISSKNKSKFKDRQLLGKLHSWLLTESRGIFSAFEGLLESISSGDTAACYLGKLETLKLLFSILQGKTR
jgi:hypothetical protein